MQTIHIGKSFELILDTLSQCGSDILKLSDEMIGHYVLEECIIGATSFFNKFTLERLESAGIIDSEISEKTTSLQRKLINLDNTDLWNVQSIKNNPKWKEIMGLSNEIKELIYRKWNDEEIAYLITL